MNLCFCVFIFLGGIACFSMALRMLCEYLGAGNIARRKPEQLEHNTLTRSIERTTTPNFFSCFSHFLGLNIRGYHNGRFEAGLMGSLPSD